MNQAIDIARLKLVLNDLRLPAIKHSWPAISEQSDKEGWPAACFLATLAEHEIAERDRRQIERHLAKGRLLPGKTLESLDFNAVPMVSKARVMAICAGGSWIESGANLILIGGPGGGKSHLASAIGLALFENGWRTLFTRTSDLVQKLQVARPRAVARKRNRQTRQVPSADFGRSGLREQRSGRNLGSVRAHQRQI